MAGPSPAMTPGLAVGRGRFSASVSRRSVVGWRRQFTDRAAGMRGGWLLPLGRAYDILVRDRLVIALLLALEIKIADAERAGAVIDAEHAAFLLVARRDEPVVARLLLCRAVAAAVAVGDPERAGPDIGTPGIVGATGRRSRRRSIYRADRPGKD